MLYLGGLIFLSVLAALVLRRVMAGSLLKKEARLKGLESEYAVLAEEKARLNKENLGYRGDS